MGQDLLKEKKMTRRQAVSTAAKVAVTAVVVGVGTGLGGYLAGTSTAPVQEVTKTERITETVTRTITQTVTGQQPTPGPLRFDGVKVTVAALAGGARGPISGPFYYYKDEVKKLVGMDIEVVELSFADLPIKIIADLTTKTGAYDGFVPCSNIMGDLVIPGYVHELGNWIVDPRFPNWRPDKWSYAVTQCSQWGGKWYGVPWDSDAWYFNWNMKYMDKVLRDPDKRREFKDKFGYELDPYGWYKRRQLTWQKIRDMCEFFTGWDWNGDGEKDWGIIMGLRVGEQGPMWFVPFAAPFLVEYGPTVDKHHNIFWFDPETMEPLLKTEGMVAAAKLFKEIVTKYMPPEGFSFTFADKWDYFLNKEKAMFCWAAPDTATLAGNPEKSKMRGYLASIACPGSEVYYSLAEGRMVQKINIVGNASGCSWHGWVSTLSKKPEAMYWLLAYLSTPEKLVKEISASKFFWTGVDPGGLSLQVLTDYGGEATLADFGLPGNFVDPGYPKSLYEEGDLRRFHIAAYNNWFAADAIQHYLRVPGATAMYVSMDTHIIGEMCQGGISPEEALDRTYRDWNKIIDEIGREKMIKYYQEMIEYKKPNPYKPRPWVWDDRAFPKDLIFG
jgi:multiple sugar transport system substrate-binding protein